MAKLNIPAFPVTKNTFQGTASDLDLADKTYNIVHADAGCSLTVTYEDGPITVTLAEGEDVTVAGALSVSSTGSIKVS